MLRREWLLSMQDPYSGLLASAFLTLTLYELSLKMVHSTKT